ncbi:MAG: ABC transporter permease [Sedimentisphaerales bacterium]
MRIQRKLIPEIPPMRSIWAVAVNMIKQALRLKIAAVFIVLLLVLLPVMGLTMTGDGTVKGRMQAFVSYGMSLTAFLLAMLTIFTTAYSLTSEVKDKQIYTVLTKPIRRFQFVLGKLLGIVILDAGLLVLFSVIIYGITILLPTVLHADEAQMTQIRDEFFTARASVKPEEPDISQELAEAYKKLKQNGEVPAGVDENPGARHNYMNELARRIGLRRRAAAVGEELLMEFNNVKPKEPNQNLFVRFKYDVAVNPQDLSIYSKWVVGDVRQLRLAANLDTPIYSLERKDVIRTFREFSVPADAVAGDDYLAVAFLNVPLNNTVVIFPFEDGLELLYKADTFTANFIRAVLLIFVWLVFLSAFAVFAGSFLSFPVAILLCLAVFTMANMTGYIGESFNVVGGNVSPVYTWFLQPILSLLPHFDKFDPSQFLVPARLLSWSLLAWLGFSTLCIRALLLVILSLLIFTYREIAKVIV